MKIWISWDSDARITKPYISSNEPSPIERKWGRHFDLEGTGDIFDLDADLATKLGLSPGDCKPFEIISGHAKLEFGIDFSAKPSVSVHQDETNILRAKR